MPSSHGDEEPTFRELATDWLRARKRNPAIAPRTTELNESQLTRYLAPFFGELRPSEITAAKVKEYRERIHIENQQIRQAANAGQPLRDARTGQRLRTLSNESINKTLLTLAQILDEAEDAGWVQRNVARGRRTREPLERRRNRGTLDVDELLALLEAAGQLDNHHQPGTLEKAARVRRKCATTPAWNGEPSPNGSASHTARRSTSTAAPRTPTQPPAGHDARSSPPSPSPDPGSAKCAHSTTRTSASPKPGSRSATQRPKPASAQSTSTPDSSTSSLPTAPADPPQPWTRQHSRPAPGPRRDRSNILKRIVEPVLRRANELRARRDEPPILVHVTPHTFRRTYISLLVAAGYDLPYVQAQVGHVRPHHHARDLRPSHGPTRPRPTPRRDPPTPWSQPPEHPGHERDAPSRASQRLKRPVYEPLKRPEKAARPIYDRSRHTRGHDKVADLQGNNRWSQPGSNRRPPACKAGALPTELWPRGDRVYAG